MAEGKRVKIFFFLLHGKGAGQNHLLFTGNINAENGKPDFQSTRTDRPAVAG